MSNSKLFRAQQEAQQTANKLQEVCLNFQQRQETLEVLDSKAVDLEVKSRVFEKSARDLRCKQIRRRLVFVLAVLLIVILLILLIVGVMGGFNRQ